MKNNILILLFMCLSLSLFSQSYSGSIYYSCGAPTYAPQNKANNYKAWDYCNNSSYYWDDGLKAWVMQSVSGDTDVDNFFFENDSLCLTENGKKVCTYFDTLNFARQDDLDQLQMDVSNNDNDIIALQAQSHDAATIGTAPDGFTFTGQSLNVDIDAEDVSVSPIPNLSAINVQGALSELQSDVDNFSGDNLGNHTATQDIDIATFDLVNARNIEGQTLRLNSANSNYFIGSGGLNLPFINSTSDISGGVLAINAVGKIVPSNKERFLILSDVGAPVDGTTIAWNENQIYRDKSTGDIYFALTQSTDPDTDGTGSTWSSAFSGGGVTGDNLFTADLTLGANRLHNLNGNNFEISNSYASLKLGNNGLFDSYVFEKIIDANNRTIVGLGKLDGFGLDEDQIILGRLNTLGQPVTSINIEPTSGNIKVNNEDYSVKSRNFLAIGVDEDPSSINPGTYETGLTMDPYGTTPGYTWEFRKNQEYAFGIAVVDGLGKKYINQYFGGLNTLNEINDYSRVECSNQGTAMFWKHDITNDKNIEAALDNSGFLIRETDLGNLFNIDKTGQVNIPNIQTFVDDTAAGTGGLTQGDLYIDPSGILRVKL